MRGREATSPQQIPAKGWKDILSRAAARIGQDRLTLIAAGVAFYGLLAIFPLIAAVIAVWGLATNPAQLAETMHSAYQVLPNEAVAVLDDQATRIATNEGGATWAAVLGILISIYIASRGVKALMEGLNVASNERETRGFLKSNLIALILTIGFIIGAIIAFALVAVAPIVVNAFGDERAWATVLDLLRWPLLLIGALLALAVLYRWGPSRAKPKFKWVTPGALAAAVLWVGASILFSIYVANFANYNATYGAIGGVIILLMWIWLSVLIVLIGQEINVEAERQTRRDSTAPPEKPIGERGAWAADTLGPRPG